MTTTAAQLGLTVGPLITYLYVVAVWQSGRRPRIIPGPIDYGLLLFGLSGPVLFGPIGHMLLLRAGPKVPPTLWAWVALASALGILALPWLPRSFRRLVVYNVEPEQLVTAVRAALSELPGHFEATLNGFEDRTRGRGIKVDAGRRLRTGLIEAYGAEPEALITLVGRGLHQHLRGPVPRASAVAWALAGICLAMLVPLLTLLISHTNQGRAVLRTLIDALHGG